MINPRFFLGPMTLNAVDAIIEIVNENNEVLGLIPSRRQVEYNGGYVNNWTTDNFCEYVKSKTKNIIIVRDHSGPLQGLNEDDGFESLKNDCAKGNMDLIHIDPWKKYQSLKEGIRETIKYINYCHQINKDMFFEVGTEEAIRRFDASDLKEIMSTLKNKLSPEVFGKIKYLVIQSGTALKETKNIGSYDKERLSGMIEIAREFGVYSKEHNGDYLDKSLVKEKFELGLDCINIAPEIGQMETIFLLEKIKEKSIDLLDKFFHICYDSQKWCKWVSSDFKPFENKEDLIKISGHYVLSYPELVELKKDLGINDLEIKNHIKSKIKELCLIM